MELLLRSLAAALSAAALCLLIKRTNPEMSLLLSLAACTVILLSVLRCTDSVRRLADTVKKLTGTDSAYIAPVLKCTAIAITTKIGASLCRDSSQSAAAGCVELAGTVCAAAATMPLIMGMLDVIGELV